MNKLTSRMVQLHKTSAEWSTYEEFIPNKGELVIFDPDTETDYSRIKIGDGETFLKDLPFVIDELSKVIQWEDETGYIDSGYISQYNIEN